MWQFDRLTTSRFARCSEIRRRVLRERRMRGSLLFMTSYLQFARGLLLLRFFDDHALADVANAFALVWFGRAIRANLRRHLPDLLVVDALDHELGLHGLFHFHALGHPVHDRMRESQRQVDPVS